jgi:hypothetical protein
MTNKFRSNLPIVFYGLVLSITLLVLSIQLNRADQVLNAQQVAIVPSTVRVTADHSPETPTQTPSLMPTKPIPSPTLTYALTPTPTTPTSAPTSTPTSISTATSTATRATTPTSTPTTTPASTSTFRPPSAPTNTPIPIPLPAIIIDKIETQADMNNPSFRVLRWNWPYESTELPDGWFFLVHFVDVHNISKVIYTQAITKSVESPDGEWLTYPFDIHKLPENSNACQPFWKIAAAIPIEKIANCPAEFTDGGICRLTQFSDLQNFGGAHPNCSSNGNNDRNPTPTRPF